MAREPLKMAAIGGTGTGKTYTSLKMIKESYCNPKNKNARKVLIYDVNDEFHDVKELAVEDIPKFNAQKKIQIRRIRPIDYKTNKQLGIEDLYDRLCDIVDNYPFVNGLLWLEDINKYAIGTNTKHFINLLTTNRHSLLDIIIHLQTYKSLPPRLWGNINVLRIHRVSDTPFISKITDNISDERILHIADLLLREMLQKDTRAYVTIYFDKSKIIGHFTLSEFKNACRKYLLKSRKVIREEMLMHNVDFETAINILTKNMHDQYLPVKK